MKSIPLFLAAFCSTLLSIPCAAQAQKAFGIGVDNGSGIAAAVDYTSWGDAGVDGTAASYTTSITGNTIPDGLGGVINFSYDLTIAAIGTANNLSEVTNGFLGDSDGFVTGEGYTLSVSNISDDSGSLNVFFGGYTRFANGFNGNTEGAIVNGSSYLRAGSGADVNNGIGNTPTWDILGQPVSVYSYAATGAVDARYVELQFSVAAPPAAPTGLVATGGDGWVTLEWDDNTEADLIGYNIYRALAGGSFVLLASTESSQYVDLTAVNDSAYDYRVTAVVNLSSESVHSSIVSATPAAPLRFGIGVNNIADGTALSYTSWAALGVDGTAGQYTLTVIANSIGAEAFDFDITVAHIGTANNLSLEGGNALLGDSGDFANGEGYSLVIDNITNAKVTFDGFIRFSNGNSTSSEASSVNGTGYIGRTNDLVDAPLGSFNMSSNGTLTGRYVDFQFSLSKPDTIVPTAPTNLIAIPDDMEVTLDWDENTEPDLLHYAVFRKSSGGTFAEIATTEISTYTDTTVSNSIEYSYKVIARDIYLNNSPDSNEATAIPIGDLIPPASPAGLVILSGNGTALLDWDDNTEPDFDQYLIYRGTPTSEFILIGATSSSDYIDAGLTNHEIFTYQIVARDVSANDSAPSSLETAMPTVTANTPQAEPFFQVTPTPIVGYTDSDDVTGIHFKDYLGFANLVAVEQDKAIDSDNDGDEDLLEYKLATDLDDAASRTVQEIDIIDDNSLQFSYYERISSPSAYARVEWTTDLEIWSSADLREISRVLQPDGKTEKVTMEIQSGGLNVGSKVFARIEVDDADYNASFISPPQARHSTAISMIARRAAFDPRAVQYYFEATSAGGNDSGWQRDPLYIDSGLRTGDTPLAANTTYTYRVKVRQHNPDTGAILPDTESEWSPKVSATTPTAADGQRPNIIVFMCDDLGHEAFDLYGTSDHNTPRITELAQQGIYYTNFHSQPLCTPSRVAMMTGRTNQRNYTAFDEMLQNTTFGNFFQNAGYRTAMIGKHQLDGNSLNGISRNDPRITHWMGFDEYLLWHHATLPPSDPRTPDVPETDINKRVATGERYWNPDLLMTIPGTHTDRTDPDVPLPVRLIKDRQWRSSNPSNPVDAAAGDTIDGTDFGPDMLHIFAEDFMTGAINNGDNFFIYYPMILPHNPFPNPPTINEQNFPTGVQSATGNSQKALTEYMDYLVGRTYDFIRNHPDPNVSQNTLIIFTSDNGTNTGIITQFRGTSYRGAKRETRDAGHHVPFVAWWGGGVAGHSDPKIPAGQVNHDIAVIFDIMATICDAAGVPIWRPASVTGGSYVEYIHDSRSFLSGLTGENRDPRPFSTQMWFFKGQTRTAAWAQNREYKLYRDEASDGHDGGADRMDRSGRFFNILQTPLERVPNTTLGGTNTIDDSLATPPPGSRLEALRNEMQAALNLMTKDTEGDQF